MTWGLAYAIDQKVLEKISPISFLFISSFFTVLVLLPFFVADRGWLKTITNADQTTVWLMALSVVLVALANYFILSSIQILGASTASAFEIAYPFFVALFCLVVFGQMINGYFAIGAVLIFAGAWIIMRFT
ncbi:MAG: hypothetical protein RL681_483 [Candidatus Parcubacteria bacterium]